MKLIGKYILYKTKYLYDVWETEEEVVGYDWEWWKKSGGLGQK